MTKSQNKNQNLKNGCQSFLAFLRMNKHIVKVSCLLLTVSVLLSACSTTQTGEPKWNDMYEVRTYDIHTETITNEIITTVFIQRLTETNKVVKIAEPTDFGGYEFEGHNPFDSRGHWKVAPIGKENLTTAPVVKQYFTTPEFQCVDGSCGIKEK